MDSKLSKQILFLAFLMAFLIFVTGFLLSYVVVGYKTQYVSELQNQITYDFLYSDIQYDLVENIKCSESFLNEIPTKQLEDVGFSLSLLEERFGKNDERIVPGKKLYTALELKHMMYINDLKKNCDLDLDVVLFFYSNEEKDVVSAEAMGRIIDGAKTEKGSKLMVYSFDYNLDSSLIDYIKREYGINKPNLVVVNEKLYFDVNEVKVALD